LIYLDTSILLAELFSENKAPSRKFWNNNFVSSKLLHYEAVNKLNLYGALKTHGETLNFFLGKVSLIALSPLVLSRALESFSAPIKTLDSLHLATALYFKAGYPGLSMATYDQKMAKAAKALKFKLEDP